VAPTTWLTLTSWMKTTGRLLLKLPSAPNLAWQLAESAAPTSGDAAPVALLALPAATGSSA
jgi:hypothetical protein